MIPERKTHRMSLEERPLSRHASAVQHRRTKSSLTDRSYRGPRLQKSTSGLKFSSSDEEDGYGDGDEGDGSWNPRVDTRARLKGRVVTESQRPLRSDS